MQVCTLNNLLILSPKEGRPKNQTSLPRCSTAKVHLSIFIHRTSINGHLVMRCFMSVSMTSSRQNAAFVKLRIPSFEHFLNPTMVFQLRVHRLKKVVRKWIDVGILPRISTTQLLNPKSANVITHMHICTTPATPHSISRRKHLRADTPNTPKSQERSKS